MARRGGRPSESRQHDTGHNGRAVVYPATVTWLVTGGAGYIGAHVVHALRSAAVDVVVVDDLSTGVAARLPADVPFEHGSLRDPGPRASVFEAHVITGVVHLAAKKWSTSR